MYIDILGGVRKVWVIIKLIIIVNTAILKVRSKDKLVIIIQNHPTYYSTIQNSGKSIIYLMCEYLNKIAHTRTRDKFVAISIILGDEGNNQYNLTRVRFWNYDKNKMEFWLDVEKKSSWQVRLWLRVGKDWERR